MVQGYRCGRCKFAWTPKTDEIPRRCPYCGRSDSLELPNANTNFIEVDDLLK
ncbi:MAG: hypothetical protein KKE23_03010 [Nanoarchaeota archaeon]|nr:hypothetical protein [Nanoarchaeota archaeon]